MVQPPAQALLLALVYQLILPPVRPPAQAQLLLFLIPVQE
jgi:hypothetical protein